MRRFENLVIENNDRIYQKNNYYLVHNFDDNKQLSH